MTGDGAKHISLWDLKKRDSQQPLFANKKKSPARGRLRAQTKIKLTLTPYPPSARGKGESGGGKRPRARSRGTLKGFESKPNHYGDSKERVREKDQKSKEQLVYSLNKDLYQAA